MSTLEEIELNIAEDTLKGLLDDIKRLESFNPNWKQEFDPEFVVAVRRALSAWTSIDRIKPDTAHKAQQIIDAETYLVMALYGSIQRVIERKRIREKEATDGL